MAQCRRNADVGGSGAYPANKTAGVPLSGQRGHVVLHDWTCAAAAFRRKHIEVIVPAVRPAFPLVETLLAKLFAALRAEKMFRVPRLLQCRHAFLKNIIIIFVFIITVYGGCQVGWFSLRPIWAHCNTRTEARTGRGSPVRSTAGRHAQRSCVCPAPARSASM